MRAVIKLYCTYESCEWVSCPQKNHELRRSNPSRHEKTLRRAAGKRTNLILENISKKKMRWKRSVILGEFHEASSRSRVTTIIRASGKFIFYLTHSISLLSSGHIQHWTSCKNVKLMIIVTLVVIGNCQGHAPVSLYSPKSMPFHLTEIRGQGETDKDQNDVQVGENMATKLVKNDKTLSKKKTTWSRRNRCS